MRPAWYDRITHRVWNGQQKYGTSTICPISLKAWSFLLFTGHKYWLPIFFFLYWFPIYYSPLLASHYLFPVACYQLLIFSYWLPNTYFTFLREIEICNQNHVPRTVVVSFLPRQPWYLCEKRKDYYNKNKSRRLVIFLKHTQPPSSHIVAHHLHRSLF